MGSHSVACHTAAVTFPPLHQPMLVLDLATPEGCKSELTWVVVTSREVYLPETVTYLRNNQAVSWPGLEPGTRKSQVRRPNHYTTDPPAVRDVSSGVCPLLCHGNGEYRAGQCVCHAGWKGQQCELAHTECEDPTCSGNGKCVEGTCLCAPGFRGVHCQHGNR